jgi:hypothetical protein
MEPKSKIPLIISFVLVLLVGIVLGVLLQIFVLNPSQRELPSNAKELLDSVYSPVPGEIFGLTGTIVAINGNEISFETFDPNEQYPGPNRKKVTRVAIVTDKTKINEINYSDFDSATGDFSRKNLIISDLSVGDSITAKSSQNIKDADRFEAESILTATE